MKHIFSTKFFNSSFIALALAIGAISIAPVAHADPAGTMNGSACDFSGAGKADGIMSNGVCGSSSSFVSQSTLPIPTETAQDSQTGPSSSFTALAPIPGLTDSAGVTSVVGSSSFASFFNNLYMYLIGLAATLAIIQIIWSGISIALNQDSVSSITDSKGKIVNAILGLILVLSPVLVFSIINPSILNLSLAIPALKTAPAQSSSALNIQGTGTVCSGYSEYRAAAIPAGQHCTDQFGGGWVNVDASCCAGQSGQSSCCGLNSSYTAPVVQAAYSSPGGETSYSSSSQIPSGKWCYTATLYGVGGILTSTQYICGGTKNECIGLQSNDSSSSNGSRVVSSADCQQH